MFQKTKSLFENKPGNINELLKQALPAAVSQGSFSLMMFTDRLLLAPLGTDAPSASMLGGFTSFLLIVFFSGLLGYITPLSGQYLGAKKKEKITPLVHQGIIISCIISPFILLFGTQLATLYFNWAGIDQNQQILGIKYFKIINICCFFTLINTVLASFFTGIAKAYIVMTVNTLGMLINIPLTYLFIQKGFFGHLKGVEGAALGSLTSSAIMCLMFIATFLSSHLKEQFQTNLNLKWNSELIKKLLNYGSASGMEVFITFAAFSSFMALFHSYGHNEALASTIVLSWEIVAFLPTWGISIGVMSLVGRYMGARDIDSAVRAIKSGFFTSFFLMILATVLFLWQSEALVGIFIPSTATDSSASLLSLSGRMLKLVCIYCIFNAYNLIISGAMRASGDTKAIMLIAILGQCLMLLVGYYSIKIAQFSPITSWTLFCLSLLLESIFFTVRFKQGRWKNIQLV